MLVESDFKDSKGNVVGWHTTIVDSAFSPLGSGFSEDKNTSRRVAVAEAIERQYFRNLIQQEDIESLGLKTHPNSDGFACGFENNATMMRAICEAVERWAWSQWIDYKYKVPKLEHNLPLSPLSAALNNQFERTSFYLKSISLLLDNHLFELFFGICIAEKDGGVFPGSRVSLDKNSLWQHGLIEAYRNYNIFSNSSGRADIICDRIKFFGKNGSLAMRQIDIATTEEWKMPRIKLLKKYEKVPSDIFLWRALCEGYIDWHFGPVDRFVY